MVCKVCASGNPGRLNAEIALTSTKLKSVLRNPPIYLIAKPVICFGCGFLQVRVPKTKLAAVRKNSAK